jgi:hypothetical protein
MIVDKKLVVSNKKKSDLEVELRKLEFKPFPKNKKAKEAGETEEFLEEEEGQAGDYDYLLGMAIWSLTREKVSISGLRPQLRVLTSHLDRETVAREGYEGGGTDDTAQADSYGHLEHGPRCVLGRMAGEYLHYYERN